MSFRTIRPEDEIDPKARLFVVNNSASNKKLSWNGGSCMLSAPGSEGSIQPLNHELLSNPHFVAMWADGRVLVTDSPSAQRSAISDIAIRNREKARRDSELKRLVVEDVSGSDDPNAKAEDVSYKAKRIASDVSNDPVVISAPGLPEADD